MSKAKHHKDFYIWHGIYDNFSDVKQDTDAFSSDRWLHGLMDKNSQVKSQSHVHGNVYPLSMVVAMLPKKCNVLDIGGGLGIDYLKLKKMTPNHDITYHIVENDDVVMLGNKEFAKDENIKFHKNIPAALNFDVIHIGSTMQYIEDTDAFIQTIARLPHKYLVLSDLMAGDIPTFCSMQIYYESFIPTWFFNLDEIKKKFFNYKYELVLEYTYDGTFLGKRQNLPMHNLPNRYQLQKGMNLVLKKNV